MIRAVCQPARFPLVFLLGDEIRAGHRHRITPEGTRSQERARRQPKSKVPSPLGAQRDATGCFRVHTVHRRGVEHEQAGGFRVKSHFLCYQPFSGSWHGEGGVPSPVAGLVEEEPALVQAEGEVAQPGPGGKRGGFGLCSAFGSGPCCFP